MSKILGMSNGKGIDPYNYDPSRDWDASCVAKSLSNICRYNGHYGWMSVAEHCMTVSRIMGLRHSEVLLPKESKDDWMLMGLLHDSFESVIGDIVTPVKHHPMFEPLCRMENQQLNRIYEMHRIPRSDVMDYHLRGADKYAMSLEIEKLGYYTSDLWDAHVRKFPADKYEDVTVLAVPNKDAEWLWLECYRQLQERKNNAETTGKNRPQP